MPTATEDFAAALDVMFWGVLYPPLAVRPRYARGAGADGEYYFRWRHGARPTPVTIELRQARRRRPVRGLTGRAWPGRDARHDHGLWADTRRACRTALDAQIVLFHQCVLAQFLRRVAFELDPSVHDDVAPVGDLNRLVEVLLGHQHSQLVLLLWRLLQSLGIRP